MAFCAKCGNENPQGASFCPRCGTPISGMTSAPQSRILAVPRGRPASTLRSALGAGCLLVLLFIIGALYMAWKDSRGSSPPNSSRSVSIGSDGYVSHPDGGTVMIYRDPAAFEEIMKLIPRGARTPSPGGRGLG